MLLRMEIARLAINTNLTSAHFGKNYLRPLIIYGFIQMPFLVGATNDSLSY